MVIVSHILLPTAIFDYLFTGFGEGDSEQTEQFHTKNESVAKETLEEPSKSSKANSDIKKTWGFRRSTVAKREMPVEAATDSSENRCPVRRSGRQSKRTDKLEEFLLTAKRGSRKSAPPSLEGGDPPSQTPTDAETASEASFDGNPDTKIAEDKVESPERRTRSGARNQTQWKAQGGRQTRGGGRVTVKDERSSDNEEDAAQKDQLGEKQDQETPEDVGSMKIVQPQPELDSEKTRDVEQKSEHGDKNDEAPEEEMGKETNKDSTDKLGETLVKCGQIRTYVNKKKVANKNTTPVKVLVNKSTTPVTRETKSKPPQTSGKTRKRQTQEDDEDDDYEEDDDNDDDDDDDDDENDSSTSSTSSVESDDGGYDPNALYCICRQKHNKRYFVNLCFY